MEDCRMDASDYMGRKVRAFVKRDLVRLLDACLNKTLGEVDRAHLFDAIRTKRQSKVCGIAGNVIEQSVLGYPANSDQAPDLLINGIATELKTTGIKQSKEAGVYEAKECLSVTAVSPDHIVHEEFDNSAFWHKLEHLLFVFYLYAANRTVPALEYANFKITGYEFYDFPESDRRILMKDWQIVRDFIRRLRTEYKKYEDEYPRISSELRPQLMYIDTAPKWPHPPRFRLKRSVVTGIVQEHFQHRNRKTSERILNQNSYDSYKELDAQCAVLADDYAGKTVSELMHIFRIPAQKTISKSISETLIVRMFGGRAKKMRDISLFTKIGLIGKSIVVTKAGRRTEDMKNLPINFNEIRDPEMVFEESSFYDYFANHQLLCIVFEEPSSSAPFSENKFLGFKRFYFSNDYVENEVRRLWMRIRELVNQRKLVDVVVRDAQGNVRTNKIGLPMSAPNFPKSSEGIAFVRGGAQDSEAKTETVNGIKMYRQYVWTKGSWLAEQIKTLPFIRYKENHEENGM